MTAAEAGEEFDGKLTGDQGALPGDHPGTVS